MNRDDEKFYENRIKDQIYSLPKEFEKYANFLINEKRLSLYEASIILDDVGTYYNVLAMNYHVIAYKIGPEELEKSNQIAESLINKSFSKNLRINLADYYQWLKTEGIVKEAIITYPTSEEIKDTRKLKTHHHHSKKKIKSSEDVHFFKDDAKKHAQTTIDGKYSLEKSFKGKYTEYTYKIHDNENDKYFLNENGEVLEIKRYTDAREFVKNLYPKKKSKTTKKN